MSDCISYRDTHYFSALINDYLDENESLKEFYGHFPSIKNFKKQITLKENSFSSESRQVLSEALQAQYKNVDASAITQENIEQLGNTKTFTVTTGHQLNLFTGPLYFLYKIVSAIKLAEQLSVTYPDYHFVPVYWMATEDHDFEEINFFNFKEEKILWKRDASGAVGELSTEGMQTVLEEFSSTLNASANASTLKSLFEKAYLKHNNLTEATRYLANELFKEYGLVIVDGNDKRLKKQFAPYVQHELLQQISYEKVSVSAQKLADKNYKVQVNPREINLFYLAENTRERLIKEEGKYLVHETDIHFSEKEILEELKNHPERFSPNVIMRPLYQEVVLPNLCYIGGGGELAYWFQLKTYFEAENIPFPVLLLRNSALLLTEKQQEKAKNLSVSIEDLFLNQADLMTKRTKEISGIAIDFSTQKEHLQQQFKDLYDLATKTDKSFVGAVAAQEKKQLNGLAHLEKRLLKAQKRKLKDELERLKNLQNEIFPNQSLQERQTNFSEFYEAYGNRLIKKLMEELKPLQLEFSIITL